MKKILSVLLAWGPAGLLLLAIADSAGVPIVGGVDALLIYYSMQHPQLAYVAAACAVLGSLIGSCILFGIARKGGEVFLAKQLHSRAGKRLHAWFEQYGLVTVFIPAASFIPLPMKIPVFCAGALEVRWRSFVSVVAAARLLRYFGLAYLALRYGSSTLSLLKSHALAIAIGAVVFAAMVLITLRLLRRRRGHMMSA